MTTQRQLRKRKRETTTNRIWRALNILYFSEGSSKDLVLELNGAKPSHFHTNHFIRFDRKYMPIMQYAKKKKIKDPYREEMGWDRLHPRYRRISLKVFYGESE